MNEEWWERPTCFICDYGWIILLVLIRGVALGLRGNLGLLLLGRGRQGGREGWAGPGRGRA